MAGIVERHIWTSPVGEMILGSIGDNLCLCDWASRRRRAAIDRSVSRCLDAEFREGTSPVINMAIEQLQQYFAGERTAFNLPVLFAGTAFQQRVWAELMKIPYGDTISYLQLAQRIGCESAVRAVANAVGANRISIIVPCHRIIGSSGALTGYAGGLQAKRSLLALEQRLF